MIKFESKTKFFLNFFLIKKAGVLFQQCVVVSYNLFIRENCKLIVQTPPPIYKGGGGMDFLKFGNKGGDEIFSRKGGVGLNGGIV